MKRLIFDSKSCTFKYGDWIPQITKEYGDSCVRKSKYVSDTVRINNNEVSTGTSRTALYTMPGGVDNGVRYAPLYESSGLDITEIEANKRVLANAKDKVEDMVKEELDKISTETANKVSMTSKVSSDSSGSSASSD